MSSEDLKQPNNEEFEILESQQLNIPNDEEKDTHSDDDNDHNENDDDDEIISPNLISPHALLTTSEPVSLATSSQSQSQAQSISMSPPPSPLRHSEQKSEIIQTDHMHESDDMNLELTPPPNTAPIINNKCQQSPIVVNHEINENQSSHNFSEKHAENKEKEEDAEPVEGIANNNPIASNINTTSNQHKVYNNPYYNGSNPTPGPDNDDEQQGEESDASSDESEYSDMIQAQPPAFTIQDDQSDEEKDIAHNRNKQQNKAHIQPPQPPPNKVGHSHINTYILLLAIIFLIIAMIAYYLYPPNSSFFKPNAPKFHCPSSVIYVPMDGNSFYINASHADHPSSTKYEWDVTNMMDYDDLFVDGEDTAQLLLIKGKDKGGEIRIDLYVSSTVSTIENKYMFNKQCSINVLFHDSPYFGIDLGTTYSCIAYQHRNETNIIVADKHRNEYCIPTALYFPANINDAVVIGEDALKKLVSDPLNVIYDIKRIVGRHCNDGIIDSFRAKHAFNVTCVDDSALPKIFVPNLKEYIFPEQALAVILAHLVEIASLEFGVPYIRDVVVSIPALFHNGQRKAIYSACSLVGLNVGQLVVEPTAAALAYSYYSSTPANNFKLFLTFDFGGGTIDCSVLRCIGVDCQVIGVRGNSSLGGIDFDLIIRDIMISKYELEHGWKDIADNDKLSARFLVVAEAVKKSLSVSTQHQITMSSAVGLKKQIIITREEFETDPRTKELIDSAVNTAKLAINTPRIVASNIRMILMIGGTTKIPAIQRRLREEFGQNDIKLVFTQDEAQLMVVKGSAIIGASFASNVESAHKQIVLEDVIPLSLGFSICLTNFNDSGQPKCGIMDVIIKKNSHYPTRATTVYCQKDPSSSVAKLDLYEGDNEFVFENYLLSHLSISNIPKRNEDVCDSIMVKFVIDKNGIASIKAIVNDKDKRNQTSFSNSLPVVSNDGSLSMDDIEVLKVNMRSWFNGHQSIQNALIA